MRAFRSIHGCSLSILSGCRQWHRPNDGRGPGHCACGISHHGFSTDLYYTNETNARASYYGISSYPTLKADGVTGMSGGGGASENMYSYYRNYYNQRVNVTSPFTIDLDYECVEGSTCRVNCTVNQVGECNGSDVRVFIALTQCNIDVSWQGMQGLHHVCRDMIPSQTGTSFTGPTMTISETFEMNWPKEDCYLTAWVQNYSGGTKEVYQAVRMSMDMDLDYDLVLRGIGNVVTQNCSGLQHPSVTVTNLGHETINTFNVRVFDGIESFTQTWNGTLIQGDTVDFVMDDFEALTSGTLQFFVEMPNGREDEFMADNVKGVSMDEVITVDGALTLQLKTGAHPENVSFEVKNMDSGETECLLTFDQANHVYRENLLLPNGACYRLTVRDEAGEGMGTGFFQVKDSNNTVVFKGGNQGGKFAYELATELDCDGYVGVPEAEAKTAVVYPNPSNGVFNLNLGQGQWQVQVYDIMGRLVHESHCDGKAVLELGLQPQGLYFLKAMQGSKEIDQKLMVK